MKYCLRCEAIFDNESWECPQCGYKPDIIDGYLMFDPEVAYVNDGYNAEDYELLREVEKGHFWFDNRNRLLTWVLREYFPTARKFCEVGCGTGFVLEEISRSFPQMRIFASDIHQRSLYHTHSRVPDSNVFQSNICQLPFKDEFNAVGVFDVLEHIDNDVCALQSIYNSLKWGGGVIITVPQHMWLWSAQDERGCHKRRYIKDDLFRKLENTGFEVMKATSFMSLLLPILIISRFRKKSNGKVNDDDELSIHPFINRVLSCICRIERYMIETGIVFPIGGSLLVVAIKNGK